MTRPITEIEADVAAARAAWQDAVEAHRQAATAVASLRARAVAGDKSLTAADLAARQHEEEFAALGISARKEAAMLLDRELLTARTEAWADEVTATEPALRADIDAAFGEVEAALQRLAQSWQSHASYVQARWEQVGSSTVSSDVTPRVRRSRIGFDVGVDGRVLALEPIFAPLDRLFQKCSNDLLSGRPKPSN
jgi:hypothetical protein